jgi:hypothetical protein
LKKVISDVTFGGEMTVDNPICEKLALYAAAHRNYLASLS